MTGAFQRAVVIGLGVALQLLVVLVLVALGKANGPALARWGVVALFVLANLWLFYKTIAANGQAVSLLACVVLAGTFVAIYQVLGFTMFPGLVKDLDLLSRDNIARSSIVFGVGLTGYIVLMFIANQLSSGSRDATTSSGQRVRP